jgi:2-oxoglutarate ferredoxin oxidoreductase subunit beta
VVDTATADPGAIVVHDAHADDPEYAFALSRLSDQDLEHTVFGVFRSVARPTYDDLVREQNESARTGGLDRRDSLQSLLTGHDTWTVSD